MEKIIIEKDEKEIQSLAMLNNDLLLQNSDLRIECNRLKSKLEYFAGAVETDESETGASFVRGIPENVMQEVGRILNPKANMVSTRGLIVKMPKLYPSKRQDSMTQTDPADTWDPSVDEKVKHLAVENEKLRHSYQLEKDINSELITSVQILKGEIDKLSTQFTQLSNDAEVALASERLAMDKLDEQDRLVQDRGLQISTLSQELDRITKDRNNLEREYHAIKKAYEALEKARVTSIDPLAFLETQWAKDRHEFYEETSVLKGSLHYLENENKLLKSDLSEKVSSLPDPAEYAKLVAERNIQSEKIKRLESKVNSHTGTIVTLEAQVLKLVIRLNF